MSNVWKFSLPIEKVNDVISFDMPVGADVLSVGNQDECICFWTVINDPWSTLKQTRRFRLAGTGHPLEVAGFKFGKFLGTVLFMKGEFVLHVWEEARHPKTL
jgi:hypothetical protein